MIITCNRILFPQIVDDEDDVLREARMKSAAKNIRKRKITFSIDDIEKFSEHEDSRYILVWFYYSEPVVIEYEYKVLEEIYRKNHEEAQDNGQMTWWIPAN